MQLNILAPMWVGDIYKQLPCYSNIITLDRVLSSIRYLKRFNAHVYFICEMQGSMRDRISQEFGDEYELFFFSNCKGYWKEYLEGSKWQENGTCIVIRKSLIRVVNTYPVYLEGGCVSTLVKILHETKEITLVSVHFDVHEGRYKEIRSLLDHVKNMHPCIISGDFNDTSISAFKQEGFTSSKFPYVLKSKKSSTHVLLQGAIDHTVARGIRFIHSTILNASSELNNGADVSSVISRTCNNPSNSDHYATLSVIVV